ncbi:hypothetical protein BDV25DRAFT_136491 [Aspergillus avenaceus]|uniref:Tyrosinase copper-binding domain-containing protein n=1 Tax=Aspergillus avenaceus TaxID=36643 RepID=A0A5N6U5S2_ASPAV|nr:hypothetical protein BDV25DRAFT_136491 [Aspergillus avenaceus]
MNFKSVLSLFAFLLLGFIQLVSAAKSGTYNAGWKVTNAWTNTDSVFQRETGISRWRVNDGGLFYTYEIQIDVVEVQGVIGGTYVFYDSTGDSYNLMVFREGIHSVSYNSADPYILEVKIVEGYSRFPLGSWLTRELDQSEKKEYIDAIWCLRHLPSHLPSKEYPGARDRWDDFVVSHINYTNVIHFNGIFLPWHRQYLHLWETTLRKECGYKGTVPYWNWALDANDLFSSPVFDGTPDSLSGNGVWDPYQPRPCSATGSCFARGSGGGCVQTGPFKDFKVHMGPFDNSLAQSYAPIPPNAFDYNPRCLSRSLNPYFISLNNNQAVVDKMLAADTFTDFQTIMAPSDPNLPTAHGSGHGTVGGAMADFFASPQDPSFMLHHAMVDRMWALWQDRDPVNRRYALNGTTIIYDPPGAPLATLDSPLEFGVLAASVRLGEAMDPMAYEHCYVYT